MPSSLYLFFSLWVCWADGGWQLEEVLYHKFVQHPHLRGTLMRTGHADLIFADPDPTLGEGAFQDGINLLGRALVTVRERLRAEEMGI